jgi:predicted metal-dependent hydrolase
MFTTLKLPQREQTFPESLALPDGRTLPIVVRSSERAARLALRVHPARFAVEIVLPHGTSAKSALRFFESRCGWVIARAAKLPSPVPFEEGAIVPILDHPHRIVRAAPGSPVFRIGQGTIEVSGAPEHLARRTQRGLRDTARSILADKTRVLARGLVRQPARISVGDASSRWGSCARSGNIKYSWRLLMAPVSVLDYVVAHEVAHLVELNHSAQFWRLVAELHPEYQRDRSWLMRHGGELHRYG